MLRTKFKNQQVNCKNANHADGQPHLPYADCVEPVLYAPHPKNVQAILDWYKEVRPDCLPVIEELFADNDPTRQTAQTLLLQGFEAGRCFQHDHPDVQSGAGYLL